MHLLFLAFIVSLSMNGFWSNRSKNYEKVDAHEIVRRYFAGALTC